MESKQKTASDGSRSTEVGKMTSREATNSDSVRSSSRILANHKSKETRELVENMKKNGARNGVDHSVVRPSIDVSVTGMKQALVAAENGTHEIRQYLFHECNVIYECKVCLNLFRSLGNLISHKRTFCQLKYSQTRHKDVRECNDLVSTAEAVGDMTATVFVVPEEPVETIPGKEDFNLKNYSPSIELLREAGTIREIENRPLFTSLQRGRAIEGVAQRLKKKVDLAFDSAYYAAKELRLEKMRQNSNAVFQTEGLQGMSMGEKYVAWQNEKQLSSGFLGPDGKLLKPGNVSCETLSDSSKENNNNPTTTMTQQQQQANEMYHCRFCKRLSFRSAVKLKMHLKRVHGQSAPEAADLTLGVRKLSEVNDAGNVIKRKSAESRSKKSDFFCHNCRKCFPSIRTLKRHILPCKSFMKQRKAIMSGRTCAVELERLPYAKVSSDPVARVKGEPEATNHQEVSHRALAKQLNIPIKKERRTVGEATRKENGALLAPQAALTDMLPPPSPKMDVKSDVDDGESPSGGHQIIKTPNGKRKRVVADDPLPNGHLFKPQKLEEMHEEGMERFQPSVKLQRLKLPNERKKAAQPVEMSNGIVNGQFAPPPSPSSPERDVKRATRLSASRADKLT